MKRHKLVLYSLLIVYLPSVRAANLWEGEEIRQGAGFPFIAKFIEADKDAPLVVFIPGARSLARISYGGHEGGLEEDFLAYWLKQRGYNFLGLSYPLLTESRAFDDTHPDITVRAWGYGAAGITHEIMQENGLTGSVIVAVWSMAGKSVQPYGEAAKKLGLDLDFHVSVAATPAIPTSRTMSTTVKMHETGLIDRPAALRSGNPNIGAPRALAKNARDNGRDIIIPTDILMKEYLGDNPVQLIGAGIRYDPDLHTFYRDHWEDMQDTRFYAGDYPLVGMLVPGQADPRHAMKDHAVWGYINANTILFEYGGGPQKVQALPPKQFKELRALTRKAQYELVIDMGGNHFFFVGEKGAKATAEAIKELEQRVHDLKSKLRAATTVGAGMK